MADAGAGIVEDPPPSLKTLLAAGTALLQPPSPLPASPPELLARLKASSARLPLCFRHHRPEWSEDTEIEQIGDDDCSNAVRRKIRRDDLVMIVAKRSLSLLVGVQGWLEMECWPESLRPGLKPSDYILGGVDNKLVQLLVSHTVSSLLLQLSVTYEAHLKTNNGDQTAKELSSALTYVFYLLAPPRLPPQPCGPSSTPRLPYTAITTTLHAKHLSNICLSCILLAYTPTTEPTVHAKLRHKLMQMLNYINPTNALAVLGATLQILLSGQKEKSPVRGWVRPWPTYILQTVRTTMSSQITKPGGARALIAYIFSDTASTAADERRLEIITKTLSAMPKGQTEDVYVPRVLDDLLSIIVFVESKPPPQMFVHAAAYSIFKLWEKYRETVQAWMTKILRLPDDPADLAKPSPEPVLKVSVAQKVIIALKALVMYAPPTAAYLSFLLSPPNIHPLFALFTYRYMAISKTEIREIATRGKLKPSDRSSHNAAGVLVMLDTWLRIATKEEAVDALWEIIVGNSIWKRSFERENALVWEGPTGQEYVINKSTEPISVKRDDPSDMSSVLRGITIDPEPDAFVALLKSIERPEVASEIFLKLLNQWRTAHNAKNGPRLLAVQFLRIVSRILETFCAKLLSTPEQLLLFVEGTLFDAINDSSDPPLKVHLAEAENRTLTDEDEIDQLSPVDISLRLMLAVLAGLNRTESIERLLLPIQAHVKKLRAENALPEIENLANEVLEKINATPTAIAIESVGGHADMYQTALQLLNDPILPVRAHGLAMLSDIIRDPKYDRSLNREILGQFKMALWNDDSFVYLQASRHLASMVFVLGPEIFRAVWALYQEAVEDTRRSQEEQLLQRSLRLGETLDNVIASLGKAFAVHAASIVPTLMAIYAEATLTTIIRASAIAILSSCVTADYLSLLPWARDLLSGVIDLLQVETVRDSPFRPFIAPLETKPAKPKMVLIEDEEPDAYEDSSSDEEPAPRTIDEDPINTQDGKHPILRRAAVSFLDVLFDRLLTIVTDHHTAPISTDTIQYREPAPQASSQLESNAMLGYDAPLLQSAITPLLYISDTDVDETTRAQALTAAASASALSEMMSLTT